MSTPAWPDGDDPMFREVFEEALKASNLPTKRKGELYESTYSRTAFLIAYSVVNQIGKRLAASAPVAVSPVAEASALIALAEKCSAEVGRYEGEVVWVKFHSQASVEAFATGVVMSAALRSAHPSAPVAPAEAVMVSDTERLAFLHSLNEDVEGYEYGVTRVKFSPAGQVIEALWTSSDHSDIDAIIRAHRECPHHQFGTFNGNPNIRCVHCGAYQSAIESTAKPPAGEKT